MGKPWKHTVIGLVGKRLFFPENSPQKCNFALTTHVLVSRPQLGHQKLRFDKFVRYLSRKCVSYPGCNPLQLYHVRYLATYKSYIIETLSTICLRNNAQTGRIVLFRVFA